MVEKFRITKAPIEGVFVIDPHPFIDSRGFFMEYYNKGEFDKLGFREVFVQDNHSSSKKGVMRGLHYQVNPYPMGKMIKVAKGRIFDVGVDIRKGSPTFGKWFGGILDDVERKMFYFPPGFAHGFLALGEENEVIYKCTGLHDGPSERGVLWNDPALAIPWPVDRVPDVIVSEKDRKNPLLKDAETNFVFLK